MHAQAELQHSMMNWVASALPGMRNVQPAAFVRLWPSGDPSLTKRSAIGACSDGSSHQRWHIQAW